MKFLLFLLGVATAATAVVLLWIAIKEATKGNWNLLVGAIMCIVAVTIVVVVASNPKIYRFFGHRWSTAVVKPGDQLDLGDGKFRLIVGNALAYKLLTPGKSSSWCVSANKPFIMVLQDEWWRRVDRHYPAGRDTWYPGTEVGYIILQGKVPDTVVELTEGMCSPRKR